jgi:hypothetical protein
MRSDPLDQQRGEPSLQPSAGLFCPLAYTPDKEYVREIADDNPEVPATERRATRSRRLRPEACHGLDRRNCLSRAAARCRKMALSSINPTEWVAMAEQWERLANTSDGTYRLAQALVQLEADISTPQVVH